MSDQYGVISALKPSKYNPAVHGLILKLMVPAGLSDRMCWFMTSCYKHWPYAAMIMIPWFICSCWGIIDDCQLSVICKNCKFIHPAKSPCTLEYDRWDCSSHCLPINKFMRTLCLLMLCLVLYVHVCCHTSTNVYLSKLAWFCWCWCIEHSLE